MLLLSSNTFSLIYIFGLTSIFVGGSLFILAYQKKDQSLHSISFIVEGGLDIILGLSILVSSNLPAEILVLFVGGWILTAGLWQIWFTIIYRKNHYSFELVTFNGIFNVFIGIVIFVSPLLGYIMDSWIVGFAAIYLGFTMLYYSYEIKQTSIEFSDDLIFIV